jgi:microcystin-dependent protein
MSQPYVGEIRIFAGNFAPSGWAFCDGQLLPISENDVLFNLIGTTYGGDGQTTFAMPDLRGRLPVHQGSNGVSNHIIGELAGVETVTLTTQQMPIHTHAAACNSAGSNDSRASGNYWGAGPLAFGPTPNGVMNPASIGPTGGNQPHDNMPPYLGLNFIISLYGIYPSQT